MKRLDFLAVLFCLEALLSSAIVSTVVFDRLPHTEDEVAFLFQARTFVTGRIVAEAPVLPDFFSMPFIIVRDGMWFGKYPPGYPLVLALGAAAGQPWLLNPLFGALSLGLLYMAGRRLYGAPTGLLAVALCASSPFFLIQSGSFLSHVVSLFWALLLLNAFDAARRTGSGFAAACAGAALGMLFLSRPLTAFGIAIPYAIWAGVDILRRRFRIRTYLPMVVTLLAFVSALLAYNNLTTGDPLRPGYELWWSYDRVGFGTGIGVLGEYTLEDGWESAKTNLESLARYLSGWPGWLSLAVPAAAAGLAAVRIAWRRTRPKENGEFPGPLSAGEVGSHDDPPESWDLLHAGTVAALVLIYLAYWAAGHMYGPRYYFEALGAIMLLSARGIIQLAGVASRAVARLAPALRPWRPVPAGVTILGAAFLTLTGLVGFLPGEFARFQSWYGVDRSELRVVEASLPANALVFIEADDWPKYAPFFSENTPTLDGEVIYARNLAPEENATLMAQYAGRSFFRYFEGELTPMTPPAYE